MTFSDPHNCPGVSQLWKNMWQSNSTRKRTECRSCIHVRVHKISETQLHVFTFPQMLVCVGYLSTLPPHTGTLISEWNARVRVLKYNLSCHNTRNDKNKDTAPFFGFLFETSFQCSSTMEIKWYKVKKWLVSGFAYFTFFTNTRAENGFILLKDEINTNRAVLMFLLKNK